MNALKDAYGESLRLDRGACDAIADAVELAQYSEAEFTQAEYEAHIKNLWEVCVAFSEAGAAAR